MTAVAAASYSQIFPKEFVPVCEPKSFFKNCAISSKVHEVALKTIVGVSIILGAAVTGFVVMTATVTFGAGAVILGAALVAYVAISTLIKAKRYYDPAALQKYQNEAALTLKGFEFLATIEDEGVQKGLRPLSHLLQKHNLSDIIYYKIIEPSQFEAAAKQEMASSDLDEGADLVKTLLGLSKKYQPAGYERLLKDLREMLKEKAVAQFKSSFTSRPEPADVFGSLEKFYQFEMIREQIYNLHKIGIDTGLDVKGAQNSAYLAWEQPGFKKAYRMFYKHRKQEDRRRRDFQKEQVYQRWAALLTLKQKQLIENITFLSGKFDRDQEAICQKYQTYEKGLESVEDADATRESLKAQKNNELKELKKKQQEHIKEFVEIVVSKDVKTLNDTISQSKTEFEENLQLSRRPFRDYIQTAFSTLFEGSTISMHLNAIHEKIQSLG